MLYVWLLNLKIDFDCVWILGLGVNEETQTAKTQTTNQKCIFVVLIFCGFYVYDDCMMMLMLTCGLLILFVMCENVYVVLFMHAQTKHFDFWNLDVDVWDSIICLWVSGIVGLVDLGSVWVLVWFGLISVFPAEPSISTNLPRPPPLPSMPPSPFDRSRSAWPPHPLFGATSMQVNGDGLGLFLYVLCDCFTRFQFTSVSHCGGRDLSWRDVPKGLETKKQAR